MPQREKYKQKKRNATLLVGFIVTPLQSLDYTAA